MTTPPRTLLVGGGTHSCLPKPFNKGTSNFRFFLVGQVADGTQAPNAQKMSNAEWGKTILLGAVVFMTGVHCIFNAMPLGLVQAIYSESLDSCLCCFISIRDSV